MIITDRVEITEKFYINPNGKMSLIDELKFVEEYLENPLDTLTKYGFKPTLNSKTVYTFLFKYGYTVLGLRNKSNSFKGEMELSDWVYNTAKTQTLKYMSKEETELIFGSNKTVRTFASLCCYGEVGKNGVLYNNIPYNIRRKCLNDWEFEREMTPFQIREVFVYKSEVDEILNLFDDYRYIVIALHMIVRAKQFQAHRLLFEGDLAINEGTYWWTPCVYESRQLGTEKKTHSKRLKGELGVEWKRMNKSDRKSVITIYREVYNLMVENGLFISNDHNLEFGLKGFSRISKYTDEYKAKQICEARMHDGKVMNVKAYRPTFLTMEGEDEIAFVVTPQDYKKGVIFKFLEFLVNDVQHECVKPFVKCKIMDCKDCGKRFAVLYDGKTKGKTPSYCKDCSTDSAKSRRKREKAKQKNNKNS